MKKFSLDYQKGIIFCIAKIIKGSNSVIIKMALDTGATYTMISHEAVAGIGIHPAIARRKIEVTTGNGIILAPVVVIPKFRTLGYEIKNLEVICHDLPPESVIEGLVGLNFLKHFNLHLKFLDNALEITK